MQVKVIVNGAQGKMGNLACKTLTEHPAFQLVGALGRNDDLRACIAQTGAEIVVDLTRADCVYQNAELIIANDAHPVIGTSGLLPQQISQLQAQCAEKKLGGLIVPNFSIAAVLMMQFAAQAAYHLPAVEIVESHHEQKVDSPSGTALKTAELIAQAKPRIKNNLASEELISGARGGLHHDINIHSLRLPGFLARQEVIFGNIGETLTITHNSLDRSCFMPGLILACQKVKQLKGLHYGLEFLLEHLPN